MNKFQEEIWQLLSEGYTCKSTATGDDTLFAVAYDGRSAFLLTFDPQDEASINIVALDKASLGLLKEVIAYQKTV